VKNPRPNDIELKIDSVVKIDELKKIITAGAHRKCPWGAK